MSQFIQRVENEIRQRGLISRGQKILAAVSGGVDSMALLHVLQALAKENRWKIVVAHFNHQLRGRASEADEKLVRRVAKKLELSICVERADVKQFAANSKISIEMAARKLRHEFFAQAAHNLKITTIGLAHHADDQVELFFLRLLRGAGGEGLAGMKWRSPSPATSLNTDKTERPLHPAGQKISLVRPLLGFSKEEILEFATAEKIRFRHDESNFSDDFLRNRIRNELLPLLKTNYQPALVKTVLRLMEIISAESEFVGLAVQNIGATAVFNQLPIALQRKILQQQLVASGIATDFERVEQLRAAANQFVSIGLGISVARDEAGKIVWRRQSAVEAFNTAELELSGRAGQAEFGGKKFNWRIKKYSGLLERLPYRSKEFFDANKIGNGIILRHWRAGDRFQPIGLHSAARLQDLFVNAKIPASKRRSLVLATTATDEIFWVEGLRIGELFKLTSKTEQQLVWEWSNLAA